MRKIIVILMLVFCLSFISAATYYVDDPTNCPTTDATNYPGQDCSPTDICGDVGGIAQCADTSLINPPSSNTTSSSSLTGSYGGGYLVNCYRTTTCDVGLCNTNSTCYTTNHRNTNCIANDWAKSDCGTCRTNYLDCNTDTYNCEIGVGSACGVGNTGTYASSCLTTGSGGLGNCTSSARLDCNDDDSDGNPVTCNGGSDGCEILIGGSCSVGTLTGTYENYCTGSVGTCTVDKAYFETGTFIEYLTTVAQSAMLWFKNYNADVWLINATNANDETWGVNNESCMVLKDGTTVCGQSDLGNSTFNQTFADERYVPYQGANANVNLSDKVLNAGFESFLGNENLNRFEFSTLTFGDDATILPYLKSYVEIIPGFAVPFTFITDAIVLKPNDLGAIDPAIAFSRADTNITGTISMDTDDTDNMKFFIDNDYVDGDFTFDGGDVIVNENISTSNYYLGSGKYLTDLPASGNLSFNQSLTDTLYAGAEWGYNQTYSGSTYNSTYDIWSYNQTEISNDYTDNIVTANNDSWSSTYNASYVPYTGAIGNVDLGVNNITTTGYSKANQLLSGSDTYISVSTTDSNYPSFGLSAGKKMMYISDKGAFRISNVFFYSDYLNKTNIGVGSIAFGTDTLASGVDSFAFGTFSKATAQGAIAIGSGSILGGGPEATGVNSIALGYQAKATADDSIAVGRNVTCSVENAVCLGDKVFIKEDLIAQKNIRTGSDYRLILNGSATSGQIQFDVNSIAKWTIEGYTNNINFYNYDTKQTEFYFSNGINNNSRFGINSGVYAPNTLYVNGSANVTGYYYGDGRYLTGLSEAVNDTYVPYTGATENVDLGTYNLNASKIYLGIGNHSLAQIPSKLIIANDTGTTGISIVSGTGNSDGSAIEFIKPDKKFIMSFGEATDAMFFYTFGNNFVIDTGGIDTFIVTPNYVSVADEDFYVVDSGSGVKPFFVNVTSRNSAFSNNVTAQYYFGDGSQLSNLPAGGNLSFNQTLTNTLYSDIKWDYNQTYSGSTYNSTYNNYAYNQTLDTFTLYNSTWDNSYGNIWFYNQTYSGSTYNETYDLYSYNHTNIIETNYGKWFYNMTQPFTDWLSSFVYNYNQTIPANDYTDAQIAGVASGNLSFNQTLTDTLYADIKWGYNQTYSGSTYNATYDSYSIWAYNQTASGGGNSSFNQELTDTLYSGIEWGYNQTYSGSTYNATYAIWAYNQTQDLSGYVPYTGANNNLTLGNYKVEAGMDSKFGTATENLIIKNLDLSGSVLGDLGQYTMIESRSIGAFDLSTIISTNLNIYDAYDGSTPSMSFASQDFSKLGVLQYDVDSLTFSLFDFIDVLGGGGNVVLDVDGNVSGSYFIGDGSYLTNLPSGGNASWNESLANTLYSDIKWGYNQTYSGSTYNSTYSSWLPNFTLYNPLWYNHTSIIEALYGKWFYNQTYSGSTYNATYAGYGTYNYNHTAIIADKDYVKLGGSSTISGGLNNIVIGRYSTSDGISSIAIGGGGSPNTGATASNNHSIAIGYDTDAVGTWDIVIGSLSKASGINGIAIGSGAITVGGIAIGGHSMSSDNALAIGDNNNASGGYSIAIGSGGIGGGPQAINTGSIALGIGAVSTGQYSLALGAYSNSSNTFSNAIGQGIICSSASTTCMANVEVQSAVSYTNFAVCYLAGGELGHCTNAVNSTGGCTCANN